MSKTDRNKRTNDPRSKPQETRSVSSSDPSLVAMAIRGDVTAFELLAMRYRRRIHSLALRITGNFHDAEDIVQQVFLKAFVNLNNYRGAAQFSTWLSRIAINEALMLKRKAKGRSEVSLSPDGDEGDLSLIERLRATEPSPEDAVSQRQWRSLLVVAISELKPKSRVILNIRDIQEHSISETANILGLSIPAVKARSFRSRRDLRQKLEHHRRLPPSPTSDVADRFVPFAYRGSGVVEG
jgi:RNA polymerase sigma-70 factor (ECF subfamily)